MPSVSQPLRRTIDPMPRGDDATGAENYENREAESTIKREKKAASPPPGRTAGAFYVDPRCLMSFIAKYSDE
jgi:hypothetical protein